MEMEMEMEMDRLSALPDDLLIRILSCHRLGFNEAPKTCLLSKRWRFVLTDLPFLYIKERSGQIERFKAGVEGALGNRRGVALERLTLAFCYNNSMASDVDACVELAAKNKVHFLDLNPMPTSRDGTDHYSLHGSMCSNSWLERLILASCTMDMAASTAVEWPSLTQISLSACILPQQVIDNILSRCPALTRLELYWCRGFRRLEIGGRRFRSLHVEFHDDGTLLEVSAPYMTDLYYGGDIRARTLRLTNVVSLERVKLYFLVSDRMDDATPLLTNASQFFHTIRCANALLLRFDHTLKLLSMMSTNGWQLPQFKLKNLIIYSDGDVLETHATVALLQSSPFLETFTLNCGYGYKVLDPIIHRNLNCDLLHLKTIKFRYVKTNEERCCKSILAWAHTLLERVPNLEEMYIYKCSLRRPLKDFSKIFEGLSSYPKSSHKARILISIQNLYTMQEF